MQTRSTRIILVDPAERRREALRTRLAMAGYRVLPVATGGDAVLECLFDPPTFLILELNLPDMDGFELCSRIRHCAPQVDITIVVLADSADDTMRPYFGKMVDFAGGDYFFAEPFDERLLVKLLDDLSNDQRPKERRTYATFPTRSIWPTTRSYGLAGIG